MFPFLEVGQLIFYLLPQTVLEQPMGILFWVVIGLILVQYRRVAVLEERLYGVARNSPWSQTLSAVAYGFLGGLLGSFILVFVGVGLTPGAIVYLWPVALMLAVINPRLMCFSYSGALVSLSYLIIGWPKVDVAGVAALVAILHITESLLIKFSGMSGRTPIFVQNHSGQVVGGFTLQRYWPVPITLLLITPLAGASPDGGINMPGWWPLVKPDPALVGAGTEFFYNALPAVVAMGYADLAITDSPARRASRSSGALALYSVILLGLAVAASRYQLLLWAAAIFTAVGHEAVAVLGGHGQLRGAAYLSRPGRGMRVLDILPGSPAEEAGLKTEAVVTAVNGEPVNSREELKAALETAPAYFVLSYEMGGQVMTHRLPRPFGLAELGIIFVPEPGDDGYVEIKSAGHIISRLLAWFRRGS